MPSACVAGLGFSDKKQLSISTCSYFMEVVKYKSLCFKKKPHILRGENPNPYISQAQGEYFTGSFTSNRRKGKEGACWDKKIEKWQIIFPQNNINRKYSWKSILFVNADETTAEKAAFCAAFLYTLKTFLMVFGNVAGNIHFLPVVTPRSSVSCLPYVKNQTNGQCHERHYKLQFIITIDSFPKQGSYTSDLLLIENKIADTTMKGARHF